LVFLPALKHFDWIRRDQVGAIDLVGVLEAEQQKIRRSSVVLGGHVRVPAWAALAPSANMRDPGVKLPVALAGNISKQRLRAFRKGAAERLPV
jgi:hypothetical protein